MKNLLLAITIGLFGALMVAQDADARRFGGGKSFGRSAPAFQRSAPQQTQRATPANPSRNTAANSGSRRWLGPLAGLVAGGLLGAMLFGDMFEGFQFMDFLLIAALVFGALFLFKRLARAGRSAAPVRREALAGGPREDYREQNAATPPIGSGLSEQGAPDQRPTWFNESEFLQAAKTHFVRLQAAWDVADMRDIRDYTTPQLFSELTLERQSYQGERQFTEVVELDAELLGVTREDDKAVAAVRFSGLVREDKDAEAKPFNEIWRIERDEQPNANWLVAGIEQSDQGRA